MILKFTRLKQILPGFVRRTDNLQKHCIFSFYIHISKVGVEKWKGSYISWKHDGMTDKTITWWGHKKAHGKMKSLKENTLFKFIKQFKNN